MLEKFKQWMEERKVKEAERRAKILKEHEEALAEIDKKYI